MLNEKRSYSAASIALVNGSIACICSWLLVIYILGGAKVQVTGHRPQATGQVTGHRLGYRPQVTGQVTGHTKNNRTLDKTVLD